MAFTQLSPEAAASLQEQLRRQSNSQKQTEGKFANLLGPAGDPEPQQVGTTAAQLITGQYKHPLIEQFENRNAAETAGNDALIPQIDDAIVELKGLFDNVMSLDVTLEPDKMTGMRGMAFRRGAALNPYYAEKLQMNINVQKAQMATSITAQIQGLVAKRQDLTADPFESAYAEAVKTGLTESAKFQAQMEKFQGAVDSGAFTDEQLMQGFGKLLNIPMDQPTPVERRAKRFDGFKTLLHGVEDPDEAESLMSSIPELGLEASELQMIRNIANANKKANDPAKKAPETVPQIVTRLLDRAKVLRDQEKTPQQVRGDDGEIITGGGAFGGELVREQHTMSFEESIFKASTFFRTPEELKAIAPYLLGLGYQIRMNPGRGGMGMGSSKGAVDDNISEIEKILNGNDDK